MARPAPRSRLVLHSEVSSRVGSVSIAGYIRNGRGVPLLNKRVFGRYALVLLTGGSGRIQVENQPVIPVRAGDLLFVYPEIPHGYGPGPGETWHEFYLVFNGPVFDLWREQGLLNPATPVVHARRARETLAQLEAIASRAIPDTSAGMLRRVSLLQQFLAGLALDNAEPTADPPWLVEAKRLLLEKPDTHPAAIARQLGLSAETFRKNFARDAGHPPARYRALRLIDQARVLMTERGLRNKEIAETLGFYDEFHFSRRFRALTGMSTREFRRPFPRDERKDHATARRSQRKGRRK